MRVYEILLYVSWSMQRYTFTISDKSEQYRLKMLHVFAKASNGTKKESKEILRKIQYVRAHCNYCSFCALIYLAHGFLIWFFFTLPLQSTLHSCMHACDAHCTPKKDIGSYCIFQFVCHGILCQLTIYYIDEDLFCGSCVSVCLHANAQSNILSLKYNIDDKTHRKPKA